MAQAAGRLMLGPPSSAAHLVPTPLPPGRSTGANGPSPATGGGLFLPHLSPGGGGRLWGGGRGGAGQVGGRAAPPREGAGGGVLVRKSDSGRDGNPDPFIQTILSAQGI